MSSAPPYAVSVRRTMHDQAAPRGWPGRSPGWGRRAGSCARRLRMGGPAMTEGTDPAAAAADAAATIARQAAEIARLQRRLEDERFAEELQEALAMAATAGTIASPVTHSRLLEMIVETAAHVTGSHAA